MRSCNWQSHVQHVACLCRVSVVYLGRGIIPHAHGVNGDSRLAWAFLLHGGGDA